MKLYEVLDFEPRRGTFELLNIRDIVDEDVLKSILADNKLKLVFNGLTLEDNFDNLITPHYQLISVYIKGEVQKKIEAGSPNSGFDNKVLTPSQNFKDIPVRWYEDFEKFNDAVYDSNTMCIYVSEQHAIKRYGDQVLVGDLVVYIRIEYMSTHKKTRIFLMSQREFYDVVDDPDVLDLKKVVDL